MHMYCRCGHPIDVTAHWDGTDYHLRMHDGREGKASPAIVRCPRCGDQMRPGDLLQVRPTVLHLPLYAAGDLEDIGQRERAP
jgi:hypothetical protein